MQRATALRTVARTKLKPATPIADTENVVLQRPLKGSLSVLQAARRDALVRCEACGRTVIRRSRQQRFCSDRCRDFVRRESHRNGGRVAKWYLPSGHTKITAFRGEAGVLERAHDRALRSTCSI